MLSPGVYTSYYRHADDLKEHVILLQVSNTKPEWSMFEIYPMLKILAPKWEYVQKLKDNLISWTEFEALYRSQLSQKDLQPIREALDRLVETTKKPVILLCWEKNHQRCHRSILSDVLGYGDVELR